MSQPRFQPLDARCAMVDGNFDLTPETREQMKAIRSAFAECAQRLNEIFQKSGVGYDRGRAIASLDHLQQAKNIACDALILPNYVKKE